MLLVVVHPEEQEGGPDSERRQADQEQLPLQTSLQQRVDHPLIKAQDPLNLHHIRLGRHALVHLLPRALPLVDRRPEQEDPSLNEGNPR